MFLCVSMILVSKGRREDQESCPSTAAPSIVDCGNGLSSWRSTSVNSLLPGAANNPHHVSLSVFLSPSTPHFLLCRLLSLAASPGDSVSQVCSLFPQYLFFSFSKYALFNRPQLSLRMYIIRTAIVHQRRGPHTKNIHHGANASHYIFTCLKQQCHSMRTIYYSKKRFEVIQIISF